MQKLITFKYSDNYIHKLIQIETKIVKLLFSIKYFDVSLSYRKIYFLFSYFSQAHSSVERACRLAAVRFHKVLSDDHHCMRGDELRKTMRDDIEKGLIPFCVSSINAFSKFYKPHHTVNKYQCHVFKMIQNYCV